MLDCENGEISTRNKYKIVVPLFGAAIAAPNKGTTMVYWFRSLSINSVKSYRKKNSRTFQGIFNFQGHFKKAL